ncbi:MAG: hypothetical protein MPL62_09265 [Alphaproteobacteria bacterium]|nr:hypothetical protein [Alphaproteobacteria bacterium]
MHAVPDSYLVRNRNTTKHLTDEKWLQMAENAWGKGSTLNITEKVRLENMRIVAIKTDSKFIGSAWHPLVPKSADPEKWTKAMTVYLNSTLGIISMLGVRTFKALPYPRWGVGNIKSIPIPILDNSKTEILIDAYTSNANRNMKLLSNPGDARGSIDSAVGKALAISEDLISHARLELSKEPMITARRYESAFD